MSLSLRPVERSDWEFILEIRNQDTVRMACHDTSIIPLEDHLKYMERITKDPDAFQWIMMLDGERIGHVKIIHSEVGFMLRDGLRGKGLGTKVYDLIIEKARESGLKKLIGVVKADNPSSLRITEKVGYVLKKRMYKDGKLYAYYLEKDLK